MNKNDCEYHSNQISEQKKKAQIATKKALSHLAKVLKMIEEDKYCPDIIQQTDAVIGLLRSTKKTLLTGHLNHCVEERLKTDKEQTVKELLKIYELSNS